MRINQKNVWASCNKSEGVYEHTYFCLTSSSSSICFWNCNPKWVSGTVPHHPRCHHTLKGLNKMAATGCCLENWEPPISQASSCFTVIQKNYINTTAISRHPSLETTLKNAVEVLPRRTAQEFQPGCWSHGANQSHHGTQHEKRW